MAERWEDWFQPGEKLLWQGAPAPGQWNILRNLFLTAFGIPFLSAGLFVSSMGLGYFFSPDRSIEFLLGVVLFAFGIPFIAVGGGMVFGTWISDWMTPTHTRYALTTRAGYIAKRLWKRNLEVLPIQQDMLIEFEEGRRGTGSVYFHFETDIDSDGDKSSTRKGFEGINDAQAVYRLLRELKSGNVPDPL